MINPRQFFRLMMIQRILVKHGLDEIVLATHLFRPVRLLLYLLPWNWVRTSQLPRAQRIQHVLEELGPIFVKFGQLLSTRRDLLPEDITDALTNLQDSVPPFPGIQARRIIEAELEQPLESLFQQFDEVPLASASIAQVHAAVMHDGREVVVKVVRPGIDEVIKRDMGLLMILAELAEKYSEDGRRLGPCDVVAEYRKTLLDELDLLREAGNATQLRRNFADMPNMDVPDIEWDLTRRSVMVMERVHGIQVDDKDALLAAGVDLKELAIMGVDIFFTQVFRDRFFHADLHPGNIFVVPATDTTPLKLVPVDFGIVGSLSESDQHYLADNFLAFFKRDYRRVAELHVESGWVPPNTRVDDFEFAIRSVCEPIFEKPIKDISFGRLLLRLFQTAQRFQMKILPQLILLQKTLVNIEGLGRYLYPDLDIWSVAMPSLEHWMSERVGARRLFGKSRENIPLIIERLPELPGLLINALEKAGGNPEHELKQEKQMEQIRKELRAANRRTVVAIVGGALLLSTAVLLGLDGYAPQMVGEAPLTAWITGSLGLVFLVSALRE